MVNGVVAKCRKIRRRPENPQKSTKRCVHPFYWFFYSTYLILIVAAFLVSDSN
jgi:hypothetical protein